MPMNRPDAVQVVTYAQGYGDIQVLGQLGHVSAENHSFTIPGGPTTLACTLSNLPAYRSRAIDPGRIVQAWRGAGVIWTGKLDEPVPGGSGIGLSAHGSGTAGADFEAVYSGTWPGSLPDDAVNQAIARGMPWTNPGIGSPSGMYLGNPVDSAAQNIATLLNLACSNGGLTWYDDPTPMGQNTLRVFPLPTMVNRLLVCTTPVPRTLGGDVNVVWLRYQVTADNTTTGAVATYALTSATNPASIAVHGRMETYADLSSAGVMSAGAAQAVGNAVLQQYVRASFAGPFTVQPGQLLTTGGQAVDLGMEQAGTVCQLILSDFAYGGEITPEFPITFLTGGYKYDDDSQSAQITPFMSLRTDFASLLGQAVTLITPLTAAA